MKLEVGKTYVLKVTDHKSCEVLHEYSALEARVRKIYPNTMQVGRLILFAVSICIPPLLLVTVPLMKKYPLKLDKPTKFGVK
jgi:hypothetical protein